MKVQYEYTLGEKLRAIRTKKKMSQNVVAKRVNVSKASISSYENDKVVPSLDVLIRLAMVYHVSLDGLVGLDERQVIVVDGLTERQYNTLAAAVELLVTGYRLDRM